MSDAQHLANNLALREKTWPWWHESFGEKLTGKARTLIQRCGIPEDEVDAHVYRVVSCFHLAILQIYLVGFSSFAYWLILLKLTSHTLCSNLKQLLTTQPSAIAR